MIGGDCQPRVTRCGELERLSMHKRCIYCISDKIEIDMSQQEMLCNTAFSACRYPTERDFTVSERYPNGHRTVIEASYDDNCDDIQWQECLLLHHPNKNARIRSIGIATPRWSAQKCAKSISPYPTVMTTTNVSRDAGTPLVMKCFTCR